MCVCVCVQVNGQSLLGASHQEAVRALRSVSDRMVILICDGDAASTPVMSSPELASPGSPVGFFSSRQGSVSSIDKDDEDARLLREVGAVFTPPLAVYVAHLVLLPPN